MTASLISRGGGLGWVHRGIHKRLLLKDGLEPSLSGPAGSTESQPVSMINNRCLYFLLSVRWVEL